MFPKTDSYGGRREKSGSIALLVYSISMFLCNDDVSIGADTFFF